MKHKLPAINDINAGFSLIEILIVLTLIMIMSATAIFYLSGHQKLYKTDDQALKIADILQEARQRSLTQRETLRVEIDLTDNIVRLIDENKVSTADDDQVIKALALENTTDVRLDKRPNNVSDNPPEPLPVPNANYVPSVYPISTTHQVSTLRFQSNGTVTDAGTNQIGSNAQLRGVTLHIWQPTESQNDSKNTRAITVIGSTGSIRLWEYDPNSPNGNKWKDSKRVGSGGNPNN